MKKLLNELGGIIMALIVWWTVALLLGMICFAVWPVEGSYTAGLSLEPQNVLGNFLGFVFALYIFRAQTSKGVSKTAGTDSEA
jgi:predicted anti-sigma-YlaC factor YlaD